MQLKHIPYLLGCTLEQQSEAVKEDRVIDCQNIIFDKGKIIRRPGYLQYGDNLENRIMALTNFVQLVGGSKIAVAFTIRDGYYYDSTSGAWKCITKNYVTGTAECDGAGAVTGSGTTWVAAWDEAAGINKIKFGTNDINIDEVVVTGDLTLDSAVVTDTDTSSLYPGLSITGTGIPAGTTIDSIDSGTQFTMDANATASGGDVSITADVSTWYGVDAITDATTIGLVGDGPTIATAVPYVLKLCFSGTRDDQFSISYPIDQGDWTNSLIVTNRVDPIQIWTGAGSLEDHAGFDGIRAKYTAYYGNQLFFGNLYDGASERPQSLLYAEIGDIDDIVSDGSGYMDLFGTEDEIMGMVPLANSMIVYKRDSLTVLNATWNVSNPFDPEEHRFAKRGTMSGRTVVNLDRYHIYLGWDNVYMVDGVGTEEIGDDIRTHLIGNINTEETESCFAYYDHTGNRYVLCVPTGSNTACDTAYVYDISLRTWTIWRFKYTDAEGVEKGVLMTAAGTANQSFTPSWGYYLTVMVGGSPITWSDMTGKWRDYKVVSDIPDILLGDEDGNVYRFGAADSDNGVDIEAYIETKDYPLSDQYESNMVQCVIVRMEKRSTGSLKVACSVNRGNTYSGYTQISQNSNGNHTERDVWFSLAGRMGRVKIKNVDGSQFKIENMSIMFTPTGVTQGR